MSANELQWSHKVDELKALLKNRHEDLKKQEERRFAYEVEVKREAMLNLEIEIDSLKHQENFACVRKRVLELQRDIEDIEQKLDETSNIEEITNVKLNLDRHFVKIKEICELEFLKIKEYESYHNNQINSNDKGNISEDQKLQMEFSMKKNKENLNKLKHELHITRLKKNELDNERINSERALRDTCNLNKELRIKIRQAQEANINGKNLKIHLENLTNEKEKVLEKLNAIENSVQDEINENYNILNEINNLKLSIQQLQSSW